MRNFKTLNIKQVSAIHSRPLSTYIQSAECPIPPAHCTCTSTIQHNEPLMWSETLVVGLLQDRSQTSRIWFWSWVWQALFLVVGLLCWTWSGLSETFLLTAFSWLRFLQ